jgi:hypothetical protein
MRCGRARDDLHASANLRQQALLTYAADAADAVEAIAGLGAGVMYGLVDPRASARWDASADA